MARVLTGQVNPTGKLAITFPQSEADLPHPVIPPLSRADIGQGSGAVNGPAHGQSQYAITYSEGSKVGYKWYEAEHKPVLFPFGFGLSYTTYAYDRLQIDEARRTVSFSVKNTGTRAGVEIAQVYVALPAAAGESFHRLAGWSRVALQPGEAKVVTVAIHPDILPIYEEAKSGWRLLPGRYQVSVGPSSAVASLNGDLRIAN